jgi:uncharacterized membrane protein YphA (DoxX/SURF4 family)
MEKLRTLILHTHHSVALDLIRMFLGVALFVRGWLFLNDQASLMQLLGQSGFGWLWQMTLLHYIPAAHIIGGLMLTFGLFTRPAAWVQLPILFGAVFFVHLTEGLFAPGQSLELAVLVLVLLAVFAYAGAGMVSLDYYFFNRVEASEDTPVSATAQPSTTMRAETNGEPLIEA